jgi:hypothetical protein
MHSAVLDALLLRLRSSVGPTVGLHVLEHQSDRLTIQVGDQTDSVIGITISDAHRPSFCASYPELSIKRNGERHVSTITSDGILTEGVLWVVGELARYGVVKPEYLD